MITRIVILLSLGFSFSLQASSPPIDEPTDVAASSVTAPDGTSQIVPEYTGCGGMTPAASNAAYEQQVVELVNAQRWANGQLPPYKRASALDSAARYHSLDMGQDNYFQHDSYDRVSGSLVFVCYWYARVATFYSSVMGENIAAGYATPASVMDGWMNSSGHRANILSTTSWEIGVGYASVSGGYGAYWTQDFGRQNGIYPLVINREAATTSSPRVSLYIYGAGTFSEMRLKNENGAWTAWQPFQSNLAWTLSPCPGTKTVTAELKSGATVVTSSDTIDLASVAPALGGLPDSLTFTYSIPDGRLYPSQVTLTPLNTAGGCPMSWTASQNGSWFGLSSTSGITPNPLTITPSGFSTHSLTTYTGSVTINAPAGAGGSPHTTNLTLVVEDVAWKAVFLPAIRR
jgi:uncharacterized protein YkwD